MGRYEAIESALTRINPTKFQRLCRKFLYLHGKHRAWISSEPGGQVGKEFTTRGTPDIIFQLPNGNYVFGEVTTIDALSREKSKIKEKLRRSIDSCLNLKEERHQVPSEKIEEK